MRRATRPKSCLLGQYQRSAACGVKTVSMDLVLFFLALYRSTGVLGAPDKRPVWLARPQVQHVQMTAAICLTDENIFSSVKHPEMAAWRPPQRPRRPLPTFLSTHEHVRDHWTPWFAPQAAGVTRGPRERSIRGSGSGSTVLSQVVGFRPRERKGHVLQLVMAVGDPPKHTESNGTRN